LLNKESLLLTIAAFIFGFGILTSCQSVRFLKSEKIKVISGVPLGTPVFRYVLEVKVSEQTIFSKITLGKSLEINAFSVVDLNTRMQSNNGMEYAPGSYRLQFDIPYNKVSGERWNHVEIMYKQKSKINYIRRKVSVGKVIKLR